MRKYIFICLFAISCAAPIEEKAIDFIPAEITACKNNGEHVYHYSFPASEVLAENLPLFVVIDVHGDGKSSVERLVKAGNFKAMVIVSSDVIQNGTGNFKTLIEELISDASARFKTDPKQIYLAGFSGGARMALAYSLKIKSAGIMMLGAGPVNSEVNTKIYAASGLRDFNFIELYRRPEMASFKNDSSLFSYFEGGHEWPETSVLKEGLLFLFDDADDEVKSLNEMISSRYVLRSDSLLSRGKGLMAWKSFEIAYKLSSDVEIRDEIEKKSRKLMADKNYRYDLTSLENHLKLEANIRFQYANKSLVPDREFWETEISKIRELDGKESDSRITDHYSRLKGYLGILLYSRLKVMMFTEGKDETAQILLNAFAKLEPQNPDMLFFKSLYFTGRHQMDSASHYLALARKNGLKE